MGFFIHLPVRTLTCMCMSSNTYPCGLQTPGKSNSSITYAIRYVKWKLYNVKEDRWTLAGLVYVQRKGFKMSNDFQAGLLLSFICVLIPLIFHSNKY